MNLASGENSRVSIPCLWTSGDTSQTIRLHISGFLWESVLLVTPGRLLPLSSVYVGV